MILLKEFIKLNVLMEMTIKHGKAVELHTKFESIVLNIQILKKV